MSAPFPIQEVYGDDGERLYAYDPTGPRWFGGRHPLPVPVQRFGVSAPAGDEVSLDAYATRETPRPLPRQSATQGEASAQPSGGGSLLWLGIGLATLYFFGKGK